MTWKFWKKKTSPQVKNKPRPAYFMNQTAETIGESYYDLASKGYMRNPIVFRCVQEIVNAAVSIPLKLYNRHDMEVTSHPLINLLRYPNVNQCGAAFLATLISHYLLSGNAYLLLSNEQPYEVYPLRPDRMKVIPGSATLPEGYIYLVDKQKLSYPVEQATGMSQILHWKQFHPLDDWYGFSSLQACGQSIETYNQGKRWNSALLQHSCRPSGALVSDNELSEEQYARLREQLDQYFVGPPNVGKTFVLEGGLNWTDMSLSPKDMDFTESMQNSAREIAFAIGVPPLLIGLPGDNTYNNQKDARVALWEQTVIPILVSFCSALTNWLPAHFADAQNFRITIDVDKIPALSDRRRQFWNNLIEAVRHGIIDTNEARQVLGYDSRTSETQSQPRQPAD